VPAIWQSESARFVIALTGMAGFFFEFGPGMARNSDTVPSLRNYVHPINKLSNQSNCRKSDNLNTWYPKNRVNFIL
jgi:hypothetical protein